MDLELKLKIFHILNGLVENRNLIRLKIEKKTLSVIRNRNFKARLLNIWNYTNLVTVRNKLLQSTHLVTHHIISYSSL